MYRLRLITILLLGLAMANGWRMVGLLRQLALLTQYAAHPDPRWLIAGAALWMVAFTMLAWRKSPRLTLLALIVYTAYHLLLAGRVGPTVEWHFLLILLAVWWWRDSEKKEVADGEKAGDNK